MTMSPDQIKAARELRDWSKKGLAKKTRFTATTIWSIETGKSRSTDPTLLAIRKTLEAGDVEITPWSVKLREKKAYGVGDQRAMSIVPFRAVARRYEPDGLASLISFLSCDVSCHP